jgi:hypothetical protein
MKRTERKQQHEQDTFRKFASRMGTEHVWSDVISRPEPEPDLLCTHIADGPIAFELVSLTNPDIAEILATGSKARQEAFYTSDPTGRIVRNKLGKKYKTTAQRIELLIYERDTITTDDESISKILQCVDAVDEHPFQRISFMGEEKTLCLWSAN